MTPAKSQLKIVRNIVRVDFVRYLLAFAAILMTGCAASQFAVIDPPSLAHQVDGSTDVLGASQGIVYHATVIDGLVVLRIENQTPQLLQFSYGMLIDPAGVTHPFESKPLPADGSVKLILPPPPPDPRGGPLLTIDLSGNGQRRAPAQDWDWPADGVVTLQLGFERPDGLTIKESVRIQRVRPS